MRKTIIGLLMLLLLMATGCEGKANMPTQTFGSVPATASLTATPNHTPPIQAPTPTHESTPETMVDPDEKSVEKLLVDFITPYVSVHESYPTDTQPTDEERHSIIQSAIYRAVEKEISSGFGSQIAARYDFDLDEAYIPAQEFVRAAMDYFMWEINAQQVYEHYKGLYGGAYNLVTPANEIVLRFGEGDIHQTPCVTSCAVEGDIYRLTLCNAVLDAPFLVANRTAEAVVQANPDSMFGYTLISYQDEPMILETTSSETKNGYPLENAFDSMVETAWVPEDPTGCWIELRFSRPVKVGAIVLYGGYGKSLDLLEKNNRISSLQAEFADGTTHIWRVDDTFEQNTILYGQTLYLPEPHVTDSIKLTVLEVYQGSVYNDTCLSELAILPSAFEN